MLDGGKINKYIAIENHPDDFILSSGMLFINNKPDTIITVFTGDKKDKRTRILCKDYNINHIELNLPNISIKDGINKLVDEDEKKLIETIKKFESFEKITQMGCGHPAHLWTSNIIQKNFNNVIFARDFPHSYKKKNKFECFSNNYINLISISNEKLFDEKINLFKKYYKTQRALLFFDKKYFDLKPSEEYYKINNNKKYFG